MGLGRPLGALNTVPAGAGGEPRLPRKRLALWLVVAALAVFLFALYLTSKTIRDHGTRLESDIKQVQETIVGMSVPPQEITNLQDALKRARNSINILGKTDDSLAAQDVEWASVMAAVANYDPTQLLLSSFLQDGRLIEIQGRAASDAVVVAYAHTLGSSALFSRVTVQSIKISEAPFLRPGESPPEPTKPGSAAGPTQPLPKATAPLLPTPGYTAMATPDVRDLYEPDGDAPKELATGLMNRQLHSFYPDGDIDRVKFMARAGRSYRVFTWGLSPLIDTVLVVDTGGTIYTNDDREPGDPSSEVSFRVDRDVQAIVEILNRGQYGPGQWYRITVEDVSGTSMGTTPFMSRSPGLASQGRRLSLTGSRRQTLPEGDSALASGVTGSNEMTGAAVSSKSVEFVIILELGVKSR